MRAPRWLQRWLGVEDARAHAEAERDALREMLRHEIAVNASAAESRHTDAMERVTASGESYLALAMQIAQQLNRTTYIAVDIDRRVSYYEKHSGTISMLREKFDKLMRQAETQQDVVPPATPGTDVVGEATATVVGTITPPR